MLAAQYGQIGNLSGLIHDMMTSYQLWLFGEGTVKKFITTTCLLPALAIIILCSGCWKGSRPITPPIKNNPYVGAMVCGRCHEEIYTDYLTTGHSQQFQLVADGQAPEYFWEDAIPFPIDNPPHDLAWEDVSLVLGGHFGFGVFFNKEGQLITGPQSFWDIQAGRWATYDPGQSEPFDCARCHMSGYDPAGFQDSFTKTDLRLIWNSADERYSFEAFVENIEDEAVNARLNVGGNDFTQTSYLAPRNSGIRFRANF